MTPKPSTWFLFIILLCFVLIFFLNSNSILDSAFYLTLRCVGCATMLWSSVVSISTISSSLDTCSTVALANESRFSSNKELLPSDRRWLYRLLRLFLHCVIKREYYLLCGIGITVFFFNESNVIPRYKWFIAHSRSKSNIRNHISIIYLHFVFIAKIGIDRFIDSAIWNGTGWTNCG